MAAVTSNVRYLGIAAAPSDGSKASSFTEITGAASGLGEIGFGKQGTVREVPGESGSITRQVLDFRDSTFSLECDRNSATRTWFDSAAEQTRTFRYGPEGTTSGKPRHTFNCLVRSRIVAPVNDVQTYELTITVDGTVDSDTF